METTTSNSRPKLYGLYAITPSSSIQALTTTELLSKIQSAIEGGARIVQYREKELPHDARLEQAQEIKILCERYDVCFLINDDVAIAREVGAAGVHLGRGDASLVDARKVLGKSAIIGISCYNQFDLALQAQQEGADYVAFGRFFSSRTKPSAVQADVDLIFRAKSELSIPVACIGGISVENAKLLVSAGADMLAVLNALFGAGDVRRAAQQLAACF
ncbi:thiamine phosphate synthase [Kaarinaea lacus]